MGRRVGRLLAWTSAALSLLLLLLAIFPWGLIARHAAGPLSKALGRPVSIGSARRTDWISFVPTIELRGVKVAQPGWAGHGEMATVHVLRMRLPVLPLLAGHVHPRAIEADGLVLHLVRDANGRDNWSSGKKGGGGGNGPRLTDLVVLNGRLRLDDAKRHVALDATFVSDRGGLRLSGAGTLRNTPLHVTLAAPAIGAADPAKPYPVSLAVRSPLASIDGTVRMDHLLDTSHFTATVSASGRDLGYLDDIIQAGLFRSQDFRLAGTIRHDGEDWHIPGFDATIGRSVLRSAIDVTRPNGRTRLNGRVDARTLDFGDFASDAQKAQVAADKARTGPRVVPDTRIVLAKLAFDGRLDIHVARLLSKGSSPFRSLSAIASLDNRRLTLSPLTVGLPQGRLTGSAVVDGRGATPRLAIDMRIAGATVESFFPDQQVVAGPLRATLRLRGDGRTVREALARGNGKLGFVVANGSVRRDYATFLGGDVFKSVGAAADGKQQRTALDCLVASFAVAHGRMTPKPLLLSTAVARGDGEGTIILGPETIDLRVVGKPTRPGLLVSTAPVRLFGTLSQPRIDIRPPRARSEKQNDIVSRVGFFVKKLRVRGSDDAKAASPVDCPAQVAKALG